MSNGCLNISIIVNKSSIQRIAVLGMQWGDEGKGKFIDALASSTDIEYVVRYQGGHNAGHTVVIDQPDKQDSKPQKIVLHLLPSAIVHPQTKCVIANGTVVYLPALLKEIDTLLAATSIDEDEGTALFLKQRLFVSEDCPVILPSHIALDKVAETRRKQEVIGTTCRGIGPAYEDYYARRAIKLQHIKQDNFANRLQELLDYHNFLLSKFYTTEQLDFQQVLDEMLEQYEQVSRYVNFTDTTAILQDAVADNNKKILFEGAQGCGLDVHHGTYPFVTSSATCVGGIFSGSGISHRDLDEVVGVTKIYATRVGEGPFATEIAGAVGEKMQQIGDEFGSTTGRPRRCGWLDLVYLKRSVKLNGVGLLFLTKVDVMDSFAVIKLCTSYNADNTPTYEEFEGWNQDTSGLSMYEELPQQLKNIISTIEDNVGAFVVGLSVGPERSKLIMRREIW